MRKRYKWLGSSTFLSNAFESISFNQATTLLVCLFFNFFFKATGLLSEYLVSGIGFSWRGKDSEQAGVLIYVLFPRLHAYAITFIFISLGIKFKKSSDWDNCDDVALLSPWLSCLESSIHHGNFTWQSILIYFTNSNSELMVREMSILEIASVCVESFDSLMQKNTGSLKWTLLAYSLCSSRL